MNQLNLNQLFIFNWSIIFSLETLWIWLFIILCQKSEIFWLFSDFVISIIFKICFSRICLFPQFFASNSWQWYLREWNFDGLAGFVMSPFHFFVKLVWQLQFMHSQSNLKCFVKEVIRCLIQKLKNNISSLKLWKIQAKTGKGNLT